MRLQLIEHIKKIFSAHEAEKPQLVGTAIQFAQQNLAPYAPQNDKFKVDLERAMALLIVPKEAWESPQAQRDQPTSFGPLWELVDPSLRIEVARDVNAAILRSQGRPDQTRIHRVLQTRVLAEELARDKGLDLPEDMSVSLWESAARPQNGHNDGGDTQMTEDLDEGTSADPVTRYTNIP